MMSLGDNVIVKREYLTVDELREALNGIPGDWKVRASVNYDHCDHVQNVKKIWVSEELKLIELIGL